MIRLLFLIDGLGSGGAQRQITTLAVLFKKKGLDVNVLTYTKENFFYDTLEKNNIPIICIEEKNPLKRILRIRVYIRNNKFDKVISFLDTPNFIACLSALGKKKFDLYISERSALDKSFIGVKNKFLKFFCRYSNKIICNSNNAKNFWVKYFPKYSCKLTTIYNVVDLDLSSSITEYKPLNNSKLSIVIASSYQYIKNMNSLIEAINMLDDKSKNKLVINWYGEKEVTKGNSRAYDEALKKIKNYRLDNIIKLNGATNKIIEKYINADIVGLFSLYEGMPNAICEAMSIGKPIIMTKVSDYDILVDSENGFLCDQGDVNSIKMALENAINLDKNILIEMGKNSKIKAKNLFNKDIVVEKWMREINISDS